MDKENSDFEYLEYTMFKMRSYGLWPDNARELLRELLLLVYMFLVALMCIAEMDPSNIEEFTFIGSVMVNAVTLFIKILMLKVFQARGEWMVHDTRRRCSRLTKEFPEFVGPLKQTELQLRKITKMLITSMVLVFCGWVVLPLLKVTGIFPEMNVGLPIKMWYPFDVSKRLYLALGVLHQMSIIIVCVPPYVAATMVYIGFIYLTCGQLKVLCLGLRSLNEKNAASRLRICIREHSSIVAFGKELESAMSPVLLLEFSACIAIICQILIQLTADTMASEHTFKFVGYLSVLLVQVWLYCYFCNQLIDYSTEVQAAAYSCSWYNMDKTYQKSMGLVIMRSQRPLQLNIGKMYVVSLGTYTEVLKFCFSAFTLLREVNKQKT